MGGALATKAMIIEHLTIQNFGAIRFYDRDFSPVMNLIGSHNDPEISAAIEFLICTRQPKHIPEAWLQNFTRIYGRIVLGGVAYTVCAMPCGGQLHLSVLNPLGADVTEQYRAALTHCPEQDAVEAFDGQDRSIPQRLQSYRNRYTELSERTLHTAQTKVFRSCLAQFIREFRPETIHNLKKYQATISPQGVFELSYPGFSGQIYPSETEQKLFLYTCFLNIAEFWQAIEELRDMHHEKKPLFIRNFLEYLDVSADLQSLVARTKKLNRQVIIMTIPGAADQYEKDM